MSVWIEIKKRIYEEERIEELLEKLGCHHIKREQHGELITAARPDGSNRRSVQVRNNENLTSYVRSRGLTFDIFRLVSYILNDITDEEELNRDSYNSKDWICNELGYTDILDGTYKPPVNWNKWLHKYKSKSNSFHKEPQENEVLPESILDQFLSFPNIWWLQEGISIPIQRLFQIGFDLETGTITIPIHNKEGWLVGVKGRVIPGRETDTCPKYFYIHSCYKSLELYNYHRAIQYILDKNEVIVVESEKTCMKLTEYGYPNCVGIGGDGISQEQICLLKKLGLGVNIVFAYDKDKDMEFVKRQVEPLVITRNVYVVYDKQELTEGKDAPVDKGVMVWRELYKSKSKIK